MDNSIHDYDESLIDLERQKEQLELVMQKMGEEWEESGPGINWLKMLPNDKENPTETKTTEPIATVDDRDLTPDAFLETNDELIHILQQQPQQPSPEYLQSLLHVNETLLAQSLAASPMIDDEDDVSTSNTNTNIIITTVASPQSEGSSSDICTPGLNSASSMTQSSTPASPDDEDGDALHLTNRQNEQDKSALADPIPATILCLPDA